VAIVVDRGGVSYAGATDTPPGFRADTTDTPPGFVR